MIVGPAWIGDMVMAQSLFKALKHQNPEQPIDVVAPGWSLPLLQRMPEVRQAHRLAAAHGDLALSERLALGRRLRSLAFDQAIVLPRSLKSAIVPWAARIPIRTGYRGEWRYGLLNDIRRLDKIQLSRTVDRYVALGCDRDAQSPLQVFEPRLEVDQANQRHLLGKLGLESDTAIAALLPGAEYGPAKQWPAHHFHALAARLVENGFHCWVLGSKKEFALGEEISASLGGVRNLCGSTELIDAVDLLSLCEVVVTNDSGLMHIAAAVGTRVVAIFGSSSPDYTPPLSSSASVLTLALDCSPCYQRACPLGHTRCLKDLRPETVLAACGVAH